MCVRTVSSSVQTKALQEVGQIARVVPIFENVKAEHSATQRDKSLNDPALPLWESTQAIAQEVCANAAKYQGKAKKAQGGVPSDEGDNKHHGTDGKNHPRKEM
jgi:hypothetical protein